MPTKVWAVGEEVLAADFNDYVQEQVIATFPNAAARTAAIPAPQAGMASYLTDVQSLQLFNGTTWVAVPAGSTSYGTAGIPAVDMTNGALQQFATVDLGSVSFARRVIASGSVIGSAISASVSVRLALGLNGGVSKQVQSAEFPTNASFSVTLTTSLAVAANTACVVGVHLMRSGGSGAYRVIADSTLSYVEATAFAA